MTISMKPVRKISVLDRVLLLATGFLAGYQIAFGIDGLEVVPMISYMIAFGGVLIAGLLIIIMGFEVLDSPLVLIFATLIPLSLSTGLLAELRPSWLNIYMIFAVVGLLVVSIFRFKGPKAIRIGSLILVHGIAGMIIFLLPIIAAVNAEMPSGFGLVGIGGAMIGLGGLLLSFLKAGRPILSKNAILTVLPSLLLAMMSCYVIGFFA